jgi:hypothetical protein
MSKSKLIAKNSSQEESESNDTKTQAKKGNK